MSSELARPEGMTRFVLEDSGDIEKIDYAARRSAREAERAASRRRSVPRIVSLSLGGLVLFLVLAEIALSSGRIHPGVSMAGVPLGGMSPESARSILETELPAKIEQPVVVSHGKRSWKVTAADVGLTFDYDGMIDRAMAVGREGGVLNAIGGRFDAWFGGFEVDALPVADRVRMGEVLARIAKGTDVEPVDASVEVEGTSAEAVDGKDGLALVAPRAHVAILEAMISTDRTVEAPVAVDPMPVTLAEARAAAQVAERMMAGPASVTYKKGSWEFAPDSIAKMIRFKRSVDPDETTASVEVTLVAYVSEKAAKKHVVPVVGAEVGKPAKNARFKTADGKVTIVPSVDGVGPDTAALAADLTLALQQDVGERTVALKTTVAEPDITTEEAREMGVKERISRYTTTYSSGNRPRVNNIHLLGDSLDGQLIAPGDSFSFNGAIGERTAAKGYQEAGAIVNGKLVPQLGGGICQVGTTLFNAVFESGLSVTERHNHSYYIDHYPKGRDATVSWGGPDLKFKNDTEDWVLVSVSYSSSSITIALYGTDPGYEVKAEVGEWKNVKDFKTEEVKDPTMYKGSKVVEDPGVKGRSIVVKRTVYLDGEVHRTDTFSSRYGPKTEVVRVGTKPKKEEAEEPESQTETEAAGDSE